MSAASVVAVLDDDSRRSRRRIRLVKGSPKPVMWPIYLVWGLTLVCVGVIAMAPALA